MDFPIDHDLHCHTRLSRCSNDPEQTPEAILAHSLPWPKVGIAHLNCRLAFSEGDMGAFLRAVPEDRFRAAMRAFAERGAGIELNCGCFAENRDRPGWREEDELRLFRFAKDEGCRFYLASDAHHPANLASVHDIGPAVVSALGLDARHLYRIP